MPQGAQFISPKEYTIKDTGFPRVFLPSTAQQQNPNTDTDSIRTIIPRFATKQPLNYLKNIEVNNKLYPVVPPKIGSSNNNAKILKYQKVIDDLKNQERTAIRVRIGYILSYNRDQGQIVHVPPNTRFVLGDIRTDPAVANILTSNLKGITTHTTSTPSEHSPLSVGGVNIPHLTFDSRIVTYTKYSEFLKAYIDFTNFAGQLERVQIRELANTIAIYENALSVLKDNIQQRILKDYFLPYSKNFALYNEPNDIAIQVGTSFVQNHDGTFYFSSSTEDGEGIFSIGIKQFLENTDTTLTDLAYLRRSGLSISSYSKLALQNPRSYTLSQKFGKYAKLIGQEEVANKNIIITDQGGYNEDFTKKVFNSSFNSDIISDSSMLIGGYGDKLKVTRFVENAQGFVEDIINEETKFNGNIVSIAGLLEKHKLVFIVTENDLKTAVPESDLYILSLAANRGINGLTKVESPGFKIKKIIQLDEDRILVLAPNGKAYTMDFSFQDTDLSDYIEDTDTQVNYTAKIQPLPLIRLKGASISLDENISISKAVIGLQGDAEFKFSVINSLTNERVYANIKVTDPNNVTKEQEYEGQLMVDNIPANGSSLPEILIEKNNGKYFEVSSIILLLGEY